ncbi:heparan-alpha-glucosaminide N-acetyltransferase domain-containing protein [Sutcliffiella cohnii]
MKNKSGKRVIDRSRFHSLDMARGIIVFLSVFLSSLPYRSYDFAMHAQWYGVTLVDIILPCFITIFGVGSAFAFRNGVKWSKFTKRTIKLIIFGLLFNMVISWSFDFSTLRFTGVLQMYALLGLGVVLTTRFISNPVNLIIVAFSILIIHGASLYFYGSSCDEGLVQPGCNPSYFIDSFIFGEEHIYSQGERGFDPEGIPMLLLHLRTYCLVLRVGEFFCYTKKTEPVGDYLL